MATAQPTLDGARVLWWNSFDVYVRCPFCDNIHHHGFTGYPRSARSISRVSHCGGHRSGSYKMVFPFDEANKQSWYSIDKKRALFVGAREDPSEYYKEDDPRCDEIRLHARQALSNKRRWHEATETIPLVDVKAHSMALSDLVNGRYDEVQRYLDSSKEADIFLHGIEGHMPPDDSYDTDGQTLGRREDSHETGRHEAHTTGRTSLHLAACEGHPSLVRLLLERGADPNAQDVDGRTPLVESCLFGRLENVRLLLQHGADKGIPSVRNNQRCLPVDFARDTKDNKEELHLRLDEDDVFGLGGGYVENTYERDKDRKYIVMLLENIAEGGPRGDGERRRLWGSAFTRASHDATMVSFTAHFDIPNQYKTIGVLYRGAKFLTMAAMSGWGHSEWETDNLQVAGNSWTSQVHSLCRRIGFKLEDDSRDHGVPGQYNACHAEKQLIAYFVDQHMFDKTQDNTKEMIDLELIKPPVSIRSAEIMVSRDICNDCKRFIGRVNKALNLDISVVASVC